MFSSPVATALCADATKGTAARSAVAIPTLQLRRHRQRSPCCDLVVLIVLMFSLWCYLLCLLITIFFLVSSCSDACPLWSPSGVAKGAQSEENGCFSGANLLNIAKMGGGGFR